jgi:hypothetical protein
MKQAIHCPIPSRRGFLAGTCAAFSGTRGLMAEELEVSGRIATSEMTEITSFREASAKAMPLDLEVRLAGAPCVPAEEQAGLRPHPAADRRRLVRFC